MACRSGQEGNTPRAAGQEDDKVAGDNEQEKAALSIEARRMPVMSEVTFYLYVPFEAEAVKVKLHNPTNTKNTRSHTLDKCVEKENYWKSKPIKIGPDQKLYKYSVGPNKKDHMNVGKTRLNKQHEDRPRKLLGKSHCFDVFRKPDQEEFEGRFLFVKMFYVMIWKDGRNLGTMIQESKNVEFNHWTYDQERNKVFVQWVDEVVKLECFSSFKSAFICALFCHKNKPLLHRDTSNLLLCKLRQCPSDQLPSEILAHMKKIGYYLLDANSSLLHLHYILNFGHLYEMEDLLRKVKSLSKAQVPTETEFASTVKDIVNSLWWKALSEEDKTKILELIIKDAPTMNAICKLYEDHFKLLPNTSAADDANVSKLKEFNYKNLNRINYFISRLPEELRPGFADYICESLITQTQNITPSDLADVILDNKFQKLSAVGIVNVLTYLTKSTDAESLAIVCKVLEEQSFETFWDQQHEETRETVVRKFVLNKLQSRMQESSNKEKLLNTFKVLQEVTEMRLLKKSEKVIEIVRQIVIQHVQESTSEDLVDAYDDIHKPLGKIAEECYLQLLGRSMERENIVGPDVKKKMMVQLFSQTSHSSFPAIDREKEKILLILLEKSNLPASKGKTDVDLPMVDKIIKLLDMDVWRAVFQASGNTDRLHKHPHYIDVKQAITWLSETIKTGQIPIEYLKEPEEQNVVVELLALAKCCTSLDENQNSSLYEQWKGKLISLTKERESLNKHFDRLRKAISFVEFRRDEKFLLRLEDLEHIKQEFSDRKNSMHSTTFDDIRNKNYWGSLEKLLDPANKLEKLFSSKLFLNFAISFIKVKTNDGFELCMSVEKVLELLTSEFTRLFEKIFEFKGQEISRVRMKSLLEGIDEQEIENELEIGCELFGRFCSPDILLMFHNYFKYENVKENIQVVLNCLYSLGYKSTGTAGSSDLISALEEFVKCKESGTLESISIQIDNKHIKRIDSQLKSEDLVDILSEMSKATNLIEFITETANDDIMFLVDAFEEHWDQLIQESTVIDFIDVHRFLSELLSKKTNNPKEFIDTIEKAYTNLEKSEEINGQIRTKMAAKISVCSCSIYSLRSLYATLSNRGEWTMEIIKSAVRDGCYSVKITANGSCEVHLTYPNKDQTKSDTKHNMDDLNDIRSRALFIVNKDKPNREEMEQEDSITTSEELQQFIEQVDLITEITRKYNALRRSGIPNYSNDLFWIILQSTDDIRKEEKKVEQELTEWNSMLHNLRKQNFFLNYFHATQLWELRSYFQKPQTEKEISDKVLALFRCIDSRIAKKDLQPIQSMYKHPKKKDIQSELQAVGSALEKIHAFMSSQQRESPPISTPTNKSDAIVKPGKLYVGVLEPGSARTVHVIMSLFLNTCASLPKPSQILFCHSQTTWEEIELLLLRTFEAYSHDMTCKVHCLANVESLPNDIQFQLVENLKRLTYGDNSSYLLAIICRGGSHHPIADQFDDHSHYFGGMSDSELREWFVQTCPNTFFVTSDLPGLGKTKEIHMHAAEVGLTLVSFPISGPFSRNYLVGRLCELKFQNDQALHFDIGEVDDPNELDTFLFELILTGMVSSRAQLFSLPTNHIYIEIANTLQQQMRDSLPICKCFQEHPVECNDFSKLICSNKLTSSVQVVCQYLKAYEDGTLENQEIVFEGPNKVQPLSSSDCRTLLQNNFISSRDLSFNILENFISVLANQLTKFNRSLFLELNNLEYMAGKSHDVRVRLFKALLEVATSFAARSIKACKETQAEALTECQARYYLKKMKSGTVTTADKMVERVKGMIQWADNDHLVIMLHSYGTITAIYRDINKVPQGVKDIFKSQSFKGKGVELEDYQAMSQDELQTRLKRICDISKKPDKTELKSLAYVLTPDNILKMTLIIQRMQAKIPVIIMGDTGCGKTSLVQYLAKTCSTPFCVFNFHAGITEKEIIDFISARNEQARTLLKENKSLWVFLDEFNTCNYIGTINEIVCHRSFHGKPLASNLVFVAACNPYRLRPSGCIMTAGLEGKIKLDEYSKLVYRVHPLPETMIDYVWDYGTLSEEDEKAYIRRMVKGIFDTMGVELLVELLAASQKFVREADQSSFCVSLRDVHRTTILMKWFYKMLQDRPGINYSKRPSHLWKYFKTENGFERKERSIVLSLAHCYLSRLPTTDMRRSYCKEMTRILVKNGRDNFSHPSDGFEQLIRAEQEDWLLRMELPSGTARNAALRENMFVILVCILNRIPVFVVGKPGSSKSLSMQVIRNNLRGRDSKDQFLKTLPKLFVVSFQGSESSTSEGIEKVFQKASKYKIKTENVLPVVLLDEIGLAEISKFNPLKVLHRLLEPGKGRFPDVAVVGISNWALDAAKMNRAVHLSRPEPDEEDLYETGLSIREVQLNKPRDRPFLRSLKCLAEAYHQYQSKQTHDNFHGLRDYYSMVKCLEISTTKPDQNNKNIQRALQRNFGGPFREKGELQTLFLNKLDKHKTTEDVLKFPVTQLICDNLHDELARHLMIITNGDSAIGILDQTLADLNKEKITIFGSQFEEDLSADYNHRVLSRIILCMEQNCVLILCDLEGIYGSLYDMLNQNYIVVRKKKYCRIALGAFSNPMCQVDDGFRCIVLVDENKVDYSDPPFLNRFEKQLLRFSDVLDAEQKEIIEELREWVKSISTVIGHEKEFSEGDMFAGFHEDTLPSLILFHSQNQDETDKEDIIAHCKDDLMYVATPDAVIRAHKSLLQQSNDEEVTGLYQNYFEKPAHEGLKIFLQHSLEAQDMNSKSMKLLVMTHSSIHTDVAKCVEGVFDVQTEKLGFFKSETELSKRMQHFWRKSKANLLVVQCRPHSEAPHMLLMKTIIEQQQKGYVDSDFRKHVCIVVHLQREVEHEEDQHSYRWQFNFLSGWRQVMIDVLKRPVIQIKEILESSIVKVLDFKTISFQNLAGDQLLWCFTRIKYPPKIQPALNDTIALVETITSSELIMECIKKLCCHWIEEEEINLANTHSWKVSVACDRRMLINYSTLVKAMQYFVMHLVRRPLARIVYFLQKESAWNVMTECGRVAQEQCEMLLCLDSVFNIHDIPDPQDAESLVVNVSHLQLQYPFSNLFFKRVDGLYEFYSEEYRRKCSEEDTLDENGELSEASNNALIARISTKIGQVIPEMVGSGFMVSHIQDYLDDALDIKSEEFSQHLTRQDRISLLKAHFVDHFPDVTQGDLEINYVPHIVTQLHSLFWMQGDTIAPLLHFVQACIPKVPLSIDELITKFYERKKKERTCKHEEETFETSAENVPETDENERRRSGNGSTEEEVEGNEDGGDESIDDEDEHENDDDGELRVAEVEKKENRTTFDEFIVQEICASLFPTDNLIEGIGGIEAWKSITTFVLSTATKYYTDVPAFYYLKVCYDLSYFAHSQGKPFSLYTLGLLANQEGEDNYLDSMRIFERICDCIEDLREEVKDKERLDEYVFLFYSRCIESNPDTPLLGEILMRISSTNDERLLQLSVPILYRIFNTEQEAFYSETFFKILDSPDDLDDFPNLIELNVALSELKTSGIDELDCHFHVICCDLINRMAFKDLNLEAVSSSEDPVLKTFLKAKEMLSRFDEENDTNGTFGFICAVSYLRAFMSSLARLLINIKQRGILSNHDLLLSNIFKDLNETLPSRMGSLSLLLVKELRERLSMYEIRQLIASCEKLHPLNKLVCWESTYPSKIGYDPFQSLAEKSEAKIALSKHVADSESQTLDDEKKKMDFAAVAFEQFYLVRSIRNLKDTEDKAAAQYLLQKPAHVPDPYNNFLLRICNQGSFKCLELEVTPESKSMEVEVAVLVQHLSAIVTSRYTGKSSNPVVCCLVDPTMMSNSYILAAPDDSSGYKCYEYFETTKRPKGFLFECRACYTKLTTREDQTAMKCPNCSCSCERKEMKENDSIPKRKMGYVYCQPETMREEMLCTRNLNPVEFRILHLIIHVALVAGYSLDLTTSNLAEFMKVDNPSDVCFQYIQVDLDVLSTILCRTKDRIIAFLHQVLEEATPLLTEDSDLPLPHDEKTRLSWESYFSKLVRPLVQKFRKNILKPRNKTIDNEDKDLESQIEELEEPQFLDNAARNVYLPRLLRKKHQNSFEKLREFYLNSSDEVKEHHQLLGLFLDYHKTLDHIGHLVALNAWSCRVDVLLSRSITRADAKTRNTDDAVISKERQRHQIAFEEFSKAWENVVHLFNDNMEGNKHISEISPVGLCLVDRQDLGRYLCATLVGLANFQNEFLDKCLAIAASGNCSALQFLCKNSTTYSFPSVHVQDAKEKEIIIYKLTDWFLRHSRCNPEYGHGTEIMYDLAKIEKDMAGCFLLGKAYLTTSKGMREFVFSKQLFHDCANILNDLDHAIPQENLPSNVETELSGSVAKSVDNIKLLEHMEIVLCFLKRSGGKPEESLLDYVKTWMNASRPFPNELLPELQNPIQLRHVCALYEFFEDKLAVKTISSVSDEYRKALSEDIKLVMDGNKVLQDQGSCQRILGATVTAMKRFIFRYPNIKTATNNCLVEFMEDPSLWPFTIRAKHDDNGFTITEVVPTLFPKVLTIAHAFEVHNYYQGRLDEFNSKKQRSNHGRGVPRKNVKKRKKKEGEGFS